MTDGLSIMRLKTGFLVTSLSYRHEHPDDAHAFNTIEEALAYIGQRLTAPAHQPKETK